MLTGIISLLGSSAVGTLLGGVFAWLNKKSDLEVKKLELAHEVNKWSHDLAVKDKDLEYAKVEAEGKKTVAIVEGDSAVDAARMAAISASFQADKLSAEELKAAGSWRWLLVLANATTKFVRPALTIALAGTAIYINLLLIQFFTSNWQLMTNDQRYDSGMQAFAWLTGQAAVVISYWFVSRNQSK